MASALAIAAFAVFLLEAILIIFANIISLVIFVRRFRHVKTYMLLINLSLADLMVGLYTVLVSINHLMAGISSTFYVSYDEICVDTMPTFVKTFSDFVILESIATLALIAVERAFAVIKPIRHRVIKTKYYRLCIFLSWCISSVPVICLTVMRCGDPKPRELTNFSLLNGLGVVYFIIMIVSYLAIYVKLRFYPIFQHNLNTQMQIRLCKTLFLATLASVISYLPYSILHVYKLIRIISQSSITSNWKIFINIATFLLCSNSFLNCMIYAWKMPAFRNELKKIFKHICQSSAIEDNVAISQCRRNLKLCHSNTDGKILFELTSVKDLGKDQASRPEELIRRKVSNLCN